MKRKRRKVKKRFWLFLIVVVVGILYINSNWLATWMYPVHYREDIRASAANYGLEPQLVAAVIRAESNFQTGRESRKGALGLMQLMPATAKEVVQKAGFAEVDEEKLLHRADVSIEVGSWYLNSLHKQFSSNSVIAVAAYNAGPGNVREWLNEGVWDGRLDNADEIPFGETRRYVQKVFYYYNKYKSIYPEF